MKPNGTLTFIRWPNNPQQGKCFGRWEGGNTIEIGTTLIRAVDEGDANPNMVRTGKYTLYIECLRLSLRIIEMRYETGRPFDTYIAMRDGWTARIVWAYRSAARWLLTHLAYEETALRRLFGQRIDPLSLPFTKRIAKLL